MNAPVRPEIVAAIHDLDSDAILNPHAARQWDGSPATAEQIAAASSARRCEWEAALNLRRLALEQSRYELVRRQRIAELLGKYARHPGELLGAIEPRMNAADRREYCQLWDELGNVMVITGEADQ